MILNHGPISKAHKLFLKAQQVHRHVSKPEFIKIINQFDDDQLKQLDKAIEDGNLDTIKYLESRLLPVKQWSIKRLRLKGRALHVKFWYNMSKDELINAITNDEDPDT